MNKTDLQKEIQLLENEIIEKKKKLVQLKKSFHYKVENYTFLLPGNKNITLLELFGDKDELIIVHNMGKKCSYCTMWADGFNGIYHHIKTKASFVLTSPDSPEILDDFAASRGWKFPIVSTTGTSFKSDMGYEKDGYNHPGISTFKKDSDGNIFHHAKTTLGPGDDYCSVWHLLDLLPSGAEGYTPTTKIEEHSTMQLANNIAIQVKDYENAIQFYEHTLGMNIEETFEHETKFTFCGTNFYVENNEKGNIYFDFATEDFEGSLKKLLQKGCKITKKYSDRSVMISDPFGMNFHLFEVKN
jgi:predicted dithiol-disulfide oxidoreductase (DUF899 family)/predicted enzyme related to lactoylglutathione lyase